MSPFSIKALLSSLAASAPAASSSSNFLTNSCALDLSQATAYSFLLFLSFQAATMATVMQKIKDIEDEVFVFFFFIIIFISLSSSIFLYSRNIGWEKKKKKNQSQ